MISFFNIQSANILVKKATDSLLPEIPLNQVFYAPMLAKVFDMQESNSYNGLTDSQLD
jgi:hypothetical protein